MTNEITRRQFVKAIPGLLAGLAGLVVVIDPDAKRGHQRLKRHRDRRAQDGPYRFEAKGRKWKIPAKDAHRRVVRHATDAAGYYGIAGL
jgi:hypothetical protein